MAWTSRRRRRREGGEAGGWSRRRKLAVAGLAVALVGFGAGYLVATGLLFPGPEPPGDLAEVPDLRETTLVEARERVRDLELVLAPADSIYHPEIEPGRIVAQAPLPGQLSRPGGEVRITLSMGPESTEVPAVEGLRAEQATAVLETVGFTVAVDSVEADAPLGRVVYAEPGAGARVTLPTEVVLAVSRGPATVSMPRLVGLEEQEATAVLDSLGLVVGDVERVFRFGTDPGRVVGQEPEPGAEVERGAAVRLTVGRRRSDDDPPGGGTFGPGGP